MLTPYDRSCLKADIRRAALRFVVKVEIAERLPVRVTDDERLSMFRDRRSSKVVGSGGPGVTASLGHGHQFEHVSVRIAEIDAAAAVPVVELAVFEAPWRAAVSDFLSLDAAQDGVEFAVADMESKMMALEFVVVVEQQRQ